MSNLAIYNLRFDSLISTFLFRWSIWKMKENVAIEIDGFGIINSYIDDKKLRKTRIELIEKISAENDAPERQMISSTSLGMNTVKLSYGSIAKSLNMKTKEYEKIVKDIFQEIIHFCNE